jgi:ABC-type sugar transport system permease subunit
VSQRLEPEPSAAVSPARPGASPAPAARADSRDKARRQGTPPRRRRFGRRHLWTIPYLVPAGVLIGFAFGYPILKLIDYSSQTRPNVPGSIRTTANFTLSVEDPSFSDAVRHNLTLLTAVPILVVVALVLSILLFSAGRASGVYRSALFLPYVVSIPVVGVTFGTIYSLHGAGNDTLHKLGLGGLAQDWLGDPTWALWAVLSVIVWKEFGLGVLLFSARMASIDPDLYDAARVDGARWWSVHRFVTLPALRQVIGIFVVIEAITMFSWVFGYIYTMTKGGPGGATVVIEYLIWTQGFAASNLGLASATAVILLGGLLVLIVALAILRALLARRPA